MPRKKTTTITETLPENTPEIEGIETTVFDSEEEEILAKLREQYVASRVLIKVFRVSGSSAVFCFESEDDVKETHIQDTYGAGKYALRIYIDGKLKHTYFMEVAAKPSMNGNGNGAHASNPSDIQNQMLRDQLAWNQQMILALLGKNNTVAAPNTPLNDIVSAITLLNGSNGNGKGFDSVVSAFTKGIELGIGKGGEMDWKSALIGAVRDIAPTVTQVIAQSKGVVPMNNSVTENAVAIPDQVLKQGLGFLKAKVLQGLPVGLALDWVIGNANEYQQFIGVALSKSFEDICKIDPEIANEPFNSWTRQFLDGMRTHFKEASQVETDDETNQ